MFELTEYPNGQLRTLELHRLRVEYEKLYALYNIILRKINRSLSQIPFRMRLLAIEPTPTLMKVLLKQLITLL